MTDKAKQTRTPRQLSSIQDGAIKLPLADRVELVKNIQASIKKEVADLQEAAKAAATIANGTV